MKEPLFIPKTMKYASSTFFGIFVFFLIFFLSGCSSSLPEETDKDKNTLRVTQEDLKKEKTSPSSTPKNNSSSDSQDNSSKKEIPMSKKHYKNPPEMQIDKEKEYRAIMQTDRGDITIELFASKTPSTVNNFVFLSREGFYEDVLFHRIIEGFMIQGGDPTRTGGGGPGYIFADEPFSGEYSRGTVAMANSGPDTNGSQFFIMHQDNALPQNYVIFGKVIEGMDVVDAIATSPVESNPSGENSSPTEPTFIKKITIEEE